MGIMHIPYDYPSIPGSKNENTGHLQPTCFSYTYEVTSIHPFCH
jgi:hypothetical protein